MKRWRGGRLVVVLPLLAAMAPGIAVAQAAPAPVPMAPSRDGVPLERVDETIASLRRLPWTMPGQLGNPAADEANRRLEDDIAEYVLTAPALEAITRMRDEVAATAAGGTIPEAKLQPLQQQIVMEYCHVSAIGLYWSSRQARAYHRDMIDTLIGRLPQPQRPQAARELQAIDALPGARRAQLAPLVQSCDSLREGAPPAPMDLPDLDQDMEKLAEKYGALRMKLAAQVDAAHAGEREVWVKRATPCPAAAPPADSPGTGRLQIRARPEIRDYYPREALQYRVSGQLKVRLSYDTTGCVTSARVLESSGSEALDAAGMQYAFAIALTPGTEDGKPMAGMAVQPINFTVQNVDTPAFGPQAPAAQPQP